MAGDAGTVLVLQEGRAQNLQVRLGLRTLDAVEVLDGLKEGDAVLLGGAMQAGDRVRATGTVSDPHTLVVCEHAGHGLHRAP